MSYRQTISTAAELQALRRRGEFIPLNPGMIGWPLLEGQQQIFALVDTRSIGVSLHDSGLMEPVKSISLVVGLGRELGQAGRPCDYCAMHALCRYGKHDR